MVDRDEWLKKILGPLGEGRLEEEGKRQEARDSFVRLMAFAGVHTGVTKEEQENAVLPPALFQRVTSGIGVLLRGSERLQTHRYLFNSMIEQFASQQGMVFAVATRDMMLMNTLVWLLEGMGLWEGFVEEMKKEEEEGGRAKS